MLKYIFKRIGLMIITVCIITMIVFSMIRAIPVIEKPAPGTDPAIIEILREKEGRDKPVLVQFKIWLENIFRDGDFGYSKTHKIDSTKVIKEKLPATVKINIIPYLISIPIGLSLGILAALKKNKITDNIISFWVMFFISVPSFVVASLLQYLFAYKWELLPPMLASKFEVAENPELLITSAILPIMALTFGSIAGLTRVSRAELTEVLTSDFMLLCRTKGLSKRQATVRHGIRNAMVPLAPSIIGGFVSILGGSLVIERIFRIPGIGGVYLEAFSAADYNVVMILMLFYTVIGLLTGLVIDLSYGFIDPRIRMGAVR